MSRDVASVTIAGRAATHPQLSVGLTGDRVNFRIVATERRLDKAADTWVDGDEFGVTVVCWKNLATAVLNTVRKGDPIVVVGRIITRRFEKNGATQYFTEVKADFVGLDVVRAGSRFTRNPMEPRPADQSGGPAEGDPGTQRGSAEPASGDPWQAAESDDERPPWESDPGGERNGALVTVD